MKYAKAFLSAFILLSLVVVSCAKNEKKSKARLQVALTDDPGDYEAVLIDVKEIRINYSGDSLNGWHNLDNVAAGSYDLLRLVNDEDTILADAEIETGRIQQIRLVLGPDNFVKVDGQLIRLETPSAQQSGLKLNIHQDVAEDILYTLLLDFDVAKSIHQTGNGRYMLKPVIRSVLESTGGSIKGVVVPDSVVTSVLALQGTDTVASTYTGANGGFIIRGLNAGIYSIHFLPGNTSFNNQIRNNINVITGQVSIVDTVRLQ